MKLTEQKSKPVPPGATPLSRPEFAELMREIPQWSPAERELAREFRFRDFREAMTFVNAVARLADDEDHHPDLFISYNKVLITLSTHSIRGLSLNDFIVAAKIDELAAGAPRERTA